MPLTAANNLRLCPIQTVSPFALMLAPVYVYMKTNQKFIAVKAPMDFFTPEELLKLAPLKSFFISDFVDSALPFREAAHRVQAVLGWAPKSNQSATESSDSFPPVLIPPAPYEVSDAILRITGPIWSKGAVIEPFFVSIFANELCDLLPGEVLKSARDQDVSLFERAILRSSWAVFLALHLGYNELSFLNQLRLRVFEETLERRAPRGSQNEVDELVNIVSASLVDEKVRHITAAFFKGRPERVAQKLFVRLLRVSLKLVQNDKIPPSIFGPKGFKDV